MARRGTCEVCGASPALEQDGQVRCRAHSWPRRTPTFDILETGDEVKVAGWSGTFVFLALVEARGGTIHVELYGGSSGRRQFRAVDPVKVKIPSKRVLERQRRLRAEKEDT